MYGSLYPMLMDFLEAEETCECDRSDFLCRFCLVFGRGLFRGVENFRFIKVTDGGKVDVSKFFCFSNSNSAHSSYRVDPFVSHHLW